MKDSYCKPLIRNGKRLTGAAARNVRIKEAGGLEKIIEETITMTIETVKASMFNTINGTKKKRQK